MYSFRLNNCGRRVVRPSLPNLEVFWQIFSRGVHLMTNEVDIDIRSLTHADVPQMISIIKRMNDYFDPESCFHSWLKVDPNGIKVAITGKDEIVGACSSVKNEEDEGGFCFTGMFVVKPEYRKRGIGAMLWNTCLLHVGSRNSGVNAVPGKLEIYRDSGGYPVHDTRFKTIEYFTSSWPLDFTCLTNSPPPGISICPFQSSHLPSILAYDYDLIGFKRTSALTLSLMEDGSKTLVALRSDGTCAGFGTVKVTCGGVLRMGPLYADLPEVAEVLLRRLGEMMIHKPMKGFVLPTIGTNQHAMKCMDRLGVDVLYMYDRLYVKKKLEVEFNKVYGLFDINFAPF